MKRTGTTAVTGWVALLVGLFATVSTMAADQTGPEPASLQEALGSYHWTYQRVPADDSAQSWTALRFNVDGTVTIWHKAHLVRPDRWWKIVGPQTVELIGDDGSRDLVFDDKFTSFKHVTDGGAVDEKGARAAYKEAWERWSPLALQTSAPPAAAAEVASGSSGPTGSTLEVLSAEAPNASDWVVAPLDETVPPGLRQNITLLRESLLDEAKAKPVAGREAYGLGSQLCETLIAVLDLRDKTLAHYGYRVAQVKANMQLSNESLNVDRNHQMSWPQYAREKGQAARIFQQEQSAANVKEELPKVEWADQAANYRRQLDSLYERYRAALRDSKK